VIVADRELVESGSDDILENAKEVDVAFLVVGDPFGYAPFLCSLNDFEMLMIV
jgi:diphthamide biosynthesis methyltransferase